MSWCLQGLVGQGVFTKFLVFNYIFLMFMLLTGSVVIKSKQPERIHLDKQYVDDTYFLLLNIAFISSREVEHIIYFISRKHRIFNSQVK